MKMVDRKSGTIHAAGLLMCFCSYANCLYTLPHALADILGRSAQHLVVRLVVKGGKIENGLVDSPKSLPIHPGRLKLDT